ncbi:hypothetical protein A9Q96_00150 [Rhodobacterales bacterium 52_120_T64]|nr:hypothetical protein A9Q96_00150 [Rhodobacterales bacterium 52_120_T64]
MNAVKQRRCAIYTRKSTNEGLEQNFNSLDAQRASCAAYVQSQSLEGWQVIEQPYDDGGFSGGSMERPALNQLIADIERGHVDIVIVYKVDRLTRSLTDFAKLVVVFDKRDVSFISVTQSFNTTTSMGRLTLNVLLSFAQFEREVTAERIRDKITASKEKGMWMGGRRPLGYDVRNRKLINNDDEAETVREIFQQYVRIGSVSRLQKHLEKRNIRSKFWTTQKGVETGGKPFSRGALYTLLQNPIYIGRIRHKEQTFKGLHIGIICLALWEKAQCQLAKNRVTRKHRTNARSPSLLTGLLEDVNGNRFRPRHANKNGARYRYYVGVDMTLPAHEIESIVSAEIASFLHNQPRLASWFKTFQSFKIAEILARAEEFAKLISDGTGLEKLHDVISKIIVATDRIDIHLSLSGLQNALCAEKDGTEFVAHLDEAETVISRSMHLKQSGHGKRIILSHVKGRDSARVDPAMVKMIAHAHSWLDDLKSGLSYKQIALRDEIDQRHVARTIRVAFLAPDITEAILTGHEPRGLTSGRLLQLKVLPTDWQAQREMLGFI